MRRDDRVLVTANWSSFCGMRGTVKSTQPHLMVLLDGDSYPIRFGERECSREPESSTVNLTGAE